MFGRYGASARPRLYRKFCLTLNAVSVFIAVWGLRGFTASSTPAFVVLALLDALARVFGEKVSVNLALPVAGAPAGCRDRSTGGAGAGGGGLTRLDVYPSVSVDVAAFLLFGSQSIALLAIVGSGVLWLIRRIWKRPKDGGKFTGVCYEHMRVVRRRGVAGGVSSLVQVLPVHGLLKLLIFFVLYTGASWAVEGMESCFRYGVEMKLSLRKEASRWRWRVVEVGLGVALAKMCLDLSQGVYGLLLLVGLPPVVIHSASMLENGRALYCGTLQALSKAVEGKDPFRAGHGTRTAIYAAALARKALLDDDMVVQAYWGGLTHDLGNIGIDDRTLLLEGPLSAHGFAAMVQHCEIGYSLLSMIPGMQDAAMAVKYHHERWDGTGHPEGLCGSSIPLLARLVALADAYDALVSPRPFRKALDRAEALAALDEAAGRDFDPSLVPLVRELSEEEAAWGQRVFDSYYGIHHSW